VEQENKEDDAAAAVLGRGHRNALLANRTRVSVTSKCLLKKIIFTHIIWVRILVAMGFCYSLQYEILLLCYKLLSHIKV